MSGARSHNLTHLLRLICGLTIMVLNGSLPVLSQTTDKRLHGEVSISPPADQLASQLKLGYRLLAEEEARKAGLPADLVDAVIKVESDYEASRIGAVGEIGLMQVRPGTAAMLGYKGPIGDLASPAINIHYGAAYLGQAWHLAKGDVCRTLMKYRAGHGEEVMTPLSLLYCARARAHLAAVGSPLATAIAAPGLVMPAIGEGPRMTLKASTRVAAAPPRHGPAFWLAEEARVRAIRASVQARWRRIALR